MNTLRQTNRLVLASAALVLAAASGPGLAQTGTGGTVGTGTAGIARSVDDRSDATTHVAEAVRVLQQMMMQDPKLAAVLKRSQGVFVVPDYGRVALGVVGARGGAGVLLVRRGGTWTNPAFYNMGGISAGLQAGVEAGSIALILNNQKALNSFMQNNKFSLNAGAGLTLVNWSAKDQANAGRGDITIWSDTEGLFASAAVSITDVNFDEEETAAYYGRRVASREILSGKVSNPHAQALRQALASAGGAGTAGSMGTSGTGTTTSSGTSGDTMNQGQR